MIRSKIRRINPEKSNKMIVAVAGGLALILLVFAWVILGGGRGSGRSLAAALSYLKNTEGLVEIRPQEREKRVLIVFNSDSKNAGNFEKIAHYAALRLARHWPDCEVRLAKNTADRVVYQVIVRNGTLESEGPPTTE